MCLQLMFSCPCNPPVEWPSCVAQKAKTDKEHKQCHYAPQNSTSSAYTDENEKESSTITIYRNC